MLFKRGKQENRDIRHEIHRPVANEPSYIARDTSFEGNIVSDGEIHIDGEVRGSISAHTCLIDAHGEVHGGISAQFVMVRGRVLGPITATQVTIQNGAHVEGNVMHESISIENGAYVVGSITQGTMIEREADSDPLRQPLFPHSNEVRENGETAFAANVLPLKQNK